MSINAHPGAAQVIRIAPTPRLSPLDVAPVASLKTTCSACHLRELCLPCGMTGVEVERLDDMMFGRRRIKAGETLYAQGDPFQFVYAVRRGTLKSSLTLADGREQVSGFHLTGEQLGLDGVALGTHGTTAVALEDTEVCAIPYAHMANVIVAGSTTEHLISRLMSREIVREHSLMMLLGSMNAEERLATFLLNLAGRLKARGYSANEFHLRMTRAEIGSHLGLKLETVSRTFSAFQKQGLLEVDKRHIRITDVDGLNHALGMHMH